MKNTIFFLLVFLSAIPALTNDKRSWIANAILENDQQKRPSVIVYSNEGLIRETYPGAIPGADNFWDYQTNGASLTSIMVFGDTIIVAYPGVDSTDPTGTTTRLMFYTVSDNGGSTWGVPISASTLPARSGYPDISTYILPSIGRSITLTGRRYNGANSRGGAFSEAALGLGSFTSSGVPFNGRDYFGHYQNGSLVAGVYSNPSGAGTATDPDSLLYVRYDFNSNMMQPRSVITVPGGGRIGLNTRYRHSASMTGQTQVVMWWCPDPSSTDSLDVMSAVVSTNSGNNWGSPITLHKSLTTNSFLSGDTCGPWFGMDVGFRPNSEQYACVWSTLSPTLPTGNGLNSGRSGGCKILYWNPIVNGGVPVVVAGKHNMTNISNANQFNGRPSNDNQVGVTPLSHPSIAWSQDGNIIICAFSAYRPGDTSALGYSRNDIWISASGNQGLTWTTPINKTETQGWDELYPVLSETGNSFAKFHMKFQATREPGSQSFTDMTPTSRVFTVYRNFMSPFVVGVSQVGFTIPGSFDLKQNYPNPFNPETNIRFDLPISSNVTLKVYNILGKEVATLLNNEAVTAGTQEVQFDAVNLSSGIYFYTLTAGNFTSTKKMMLMK